jgi:hypothetical protein
MDARRAPAWIGQTHFCRSTLSHLARDTGSTVPCAAFPGPVQTKSPAMPSDDRLRLHDHQGRTPAGPTARQPSPEDTIESPQSQPAISARCNTSNWWRNAKTSACRAARVRKQPGREESREKRTTIILTSRPQTCKLNSSAGMEFLVGTAWTMCSCSTKRPFVVSFVLIWITITIENASLPRQGLARAAIDPAGANGESRGAAPGRWPALPLRTTGRLKPCPSLI